MMKTEPAFPCIDHDEQRQPYYAYLGMTLHDYFIAHAPTEPQAWFKPAMPPRPPPIWKIDDGKLTFADTHSASQVCGDCFHNANGKLAAAWDAEEEKQRYIQWPAAWADAMLAERKKEIT